MNKIKDFKQRDASGNDLIHCKSYRTHPNMENNSFIKNDNKKVSYIPLSVKSKLKGENDHFNDKFRKVNLILKKTISELADENGFIEYLNLKVFFSDLQRSYKFFDNISVILSDVRKFCSLDLDKIHFNHIAIIMKSEKFDNIYEALLTARNNQPYNYNQEIVKVSTTTTTNSHNNNCDKRFRFDCITKIRATMKLRGSGLNVMKMRAIFLI